MQVDLCTDVGCVDRVDIDSRAKKVCCRRMSDRAGTDRPVDQCRMGTCGGADVLADQSNEHRVWIALGSDGLERLEHQETGERLRDGGQGRD